MGWEKKLAVVGAVPLVLIPVMFLTLFSEALAERFDLLTPGTVAMLFFSSSFRRMAWASVPLVGYCWSISFLGS